MPDTTHRELDSIDAPDTREGGCDVDARAAPRTLLGPAIANLGVALVQRKLARRLARRSAPHGGVAPDAEASVTRAATSSGSPLPSTLQRRFEGALGADLGAVRVHTGEPSATAAAAVEARAYTVGQDIHFAAGAYDPSSAGGEHLLAHEVAHTVQQAGGAESRRQYQLEVSQPGDAAEVEADRVADAIVAGAPAPTPGAGAPSATAARQIQRHPGDPPPARPASPASPADHGAPLQLGGNYHFEVPADLQQEALRLRRNETGQLPEVPDLQLRPPFAEAEARHREHLGAILRGQFLHGTGPGRPPARDRQAPLRGAADASREPPAAAPDANAAQPDAPPQEGSVDDFVSALVERLRGVFIDQALAAIRANYAAAPRGQQIVALTAGGSIAAMVGAGYLAATGSVTVPPNWFGFGLTVTAHDREVSVQGTVDVARVMELAAGSPRPAPQPQSPSAARVDLLTAFQSSPPVSHRLERILEPLHAEDRARLRADRELLEEARRRLEPAEYQQFRHALGLPPESSRETGAQR